MPFQRVALALLILPAVYADTTYTYQNGINSYTGASDVSINTQYSQYNGGNGVQWTGDAELGCYTVTGSGGYTARYLLKFSGLTIPAGSKISSATLTLSLDSWNSDAGNITGFYLMNSWNPASTRLGWVHKDDTTDWAAAGASSAGVDTVAGTTFTVPALRPVGVQAVSIPLDLNVVQGWIDNPASNQGIMLVNNLNNETVKPVSTVGPQASRPVLTIVVSGSQTIPVSVSLSPTTATVQTGGTQQFSASVMGSSNTAVNWSATGGTISSSGLFTAGSTVGNFTVTATSAADTTKSASAQIAIQAPRPVSVSLSPATATVQTGATQQFTATVTGSTNTSVTWAATGGTISSTGLFTAASTAGSFSVTATSAADTTKSASAQVTVQAPTVITVSVSPATASVLAGQTQQFVATVTGASNTAVTWSANSGAISTSGLFTAGSSAGTVKVKATSVQDKTKSATATVTVTVPVVITVSVSPASVTLVTGGTQQFTATVKGASNKGVTWSATGGSVTTGGLFTAGSSPGSFQVTASSTQDSTKSASSAVTVVPQGNTTDHPRMFLDTTTLSTLQGRAAANTAQWKALKATCDSLVGGTVNPPGGNAYPNLPNVGEGYQGSSYMDAMMPLGLCYNILKTSDPTDAANYGAKGVAILSAMSNPSSQTVNGTSIYLRDDGYGIRFYGTMMALGYDWFHDLLTPALQTQLQNTLNSWISTFETSGQIAFEYEQPVGNYYAGYYAAKAYAALAVQGDAPIGDTWWNDWYTRVHNQVVAPFYAINLANGGWPEGFGNYGPLSILNMSMPALAVRTAKGIDLIHSATQPYSFPLDNARYLMHFTWPSRTLIDDRDSEQSRSDNLWPGTPDTGVYSFLAGYLAMWNDPLAPAVHKYAREAKAALTAEGVGPNDTWAEFLFWDDTAPEADYTTATPSYLASGTGEVSGRSDWTNTATWMSFRGGPYVNNPGAGHQSFDPGSLALVKGNVPLLVNVEGWLAHQPNADAGQNDIYDDDFGSSSDHTHGDRKLYNTFQTRHVDSSGAILDTYGTMAEERSDGARTGISRYEDGGSYVLALSTHLEDMYRPFQTICAGSSPVTSMSRQVLYLRPSQFVVYDRSTVCDASLDQYLAFHFPASPAEVTAPGAGLHRFDVYDGPFAGSMTTILPANASITTTDNVANDSAVLGKVWRSEVRPTDAATASRLWLTVFDMAPSSAQVAAATPVTVISGAITGAVLAAPAGNTVTVFGTVEAGTAISGNIAYSVPAALTHHVITDLTPQGAYSVSVSGAGSSQMITIVPGGTLHASANGVLSFTVSATGAIQ